MSVLTIAQIKSEIRVILGGRTDGDSRLNGVINMSNQRLSRLYDFDELRGRATLTTVVTANAADDKYISLATLGRFRKIYDIRRYSTNVLSEKLKKISPKRWDKAVPEPEYYSRGVPKMYTMWGKDEIELWRVPDIQYTLHVRFSRWPTIVDDSMDGQNLDLENVDDLIIHLAASYLALSFGNQEKSNELFAIYRSLAREAIGEDDEDFDRAMSGDSRSGVNPSLGYNDPFVRSIEVDQSVD